MMRGVLDIAADHPAYDGHFPAFPVLPGAVLLDVALAAIQQARGIDLTAWQIASAKFLAVVRPGDALAVEHEAPGAGTIRFTIRSDDRTVATGTLSLSAKASAA
jgi:3-hydroxymyristoyl/3-hydroxydecanoyl-(acyl carrier protein) dehydratase